MKSFLVIMREFPVEHRGLGLQSIEIKLLAQAVNTFVSMLHAAILSKHFLKCAIECMQLEVGIAQFFLNLRCNDFKIFATESWLSHLQQGFAVFQNTNKSFSNI